MTLDHSEPYNRGYKAYELGRSVDDNPFSALLQYEMNYEWNLGWHDAQRWRRM